jgi:hypothetical protein
MTSKSDLALLRQQRKEAIASCDFQKAKLIAFHLRELTGRQDETEAEHHGHKNQLDYDQVKEDVRAKAQEAHASAVEEIFRIEGEFQARLTTLKEHQAEEFSAHAGSLAAELELCAIRGVPESIKMERQARIVAELGEYERAESLLEESSSARAAAIQSRQDELKEIYDRLMQQLDLKHNEEIRLNQEKKIQRIGEVKLKYGRVIETLRKQLANAAYKYQVARDPTEEETFFQELSTPETESQEQPIRPTYGSTSQLVKSARGEKSPPSRRTPTSPRSPKSPPRSRFSPARRHATAP